MRGFFSKIDHKDFYALRRRRGGGKGMRSTGTQAPKEPCEVCGLYKQCLSPKMDYTGDGELGVLIIAEAPGRKEDEQGIQLVGPAGQLKREKLENHGLDLDRDFWKINAVNCRPTNKKGDKGRKPTVKELKCCKPRIDKAIQELKPKFIWLLGTEAVKSFYMGRFSDRSISRWRHWCIPDRGTEAWVVPLFHPSFMLRREGDLNLESTYDRDLKWAISCLDRPAPTFVDEEDYVDVLSDFDEVCYLLDYLVSGKVSKVAFDYETTGLKPHREGHKILTISIGVLINELDEDFRRRFNLLDFKFELDYFSFSFPYQYRDFWGDKFPIIEEKWIKFLKSSVAKIAQNLRFEDSWCRVRVGVEPVNWHWCTMTTTHVLDTRGGITGLDFQSYRRWGVEGYGKEVEKFKKTPGANDINRLEEFPLDKLLLYGGIDGLLTIRLYSEQVHEFHLSPELQPRSKLAKANAFFHEGNLVFCDLQDTGFCVDEEHYESEYQRLTEEIDTITEGLLSSPEAMKFTEETKGEFNLASNPDIQMLLFDILKLTPVKLTAKKQAPAVDYETLTTLDEQLDLPFLRDLVHLRKISKLRNTDLAQFRREVVGGKVYPFFNLNTTRTLRSSASKPSFHNIPNREEEARKCIRAGIIPSPGNKIAGIDYSGIEVRVMVCYTLDPVLKAYVDDPASDMHRDQAQEIFLLTAELMTKPLRQSGKNEFVFPEWYGDYWRNCAKSLWKTALTEKTAEGQLVVEYMHEAGLKLLGRKRQRRGGTGYNYEVFESHIQDVENAFWKKYHVTREWRDSVISFYRRKGYVELLDGFRRGGYLRNNEIGNTPIQGLAFHCLLWSMIELKKIRKQEQWKTI